jgi:endonuclease/exonuclease/phosphatase family metal-dependent hydrolase
VLAPLDADVIGLQETFRVDGTPGVAAETAAALGYEFVDHTTCRAAVFPDKPNTTLGPGEGDFGLSVLSRWPISSARILPLGRPWRDRADRAAIRTEVHVDGAPLVFVSAHLSHRLWGTVVQQPRLRRQLLAADPGAPTVVVGDFNFWGPPTGALMRPFRRTVRGRTWPAHRPHSQIDHVLVGGGVELVDGGVQPETPSDHRPLRAVLAW